MIFGVLLTAFNVVAAGQQPAATEAQSSEFFEARVRPVLASNCYECHTDQRNGGLRVDSREALLKGGRRGPAIVPGDPDNSLLMQAVRQTNDALKMPKGGRLAPAEFDALAEWIRGGAVWPAAPPATTVSTSVPGAAASNTVAGSRAAAYAITPEQRAFWSFQPIRRPAVPAVSHGTWPKSDIDRFIV